MANCCKPYCVTDMHKPRTSHFLESWISSSTYQLVHFKMHLALHLEVICNGTSSAYWGARAFSTIIRHFNKESPWNPILYRLYNDVELVFSSRRSTDYWSLICRDSHFYISRTQRTRVNRNKHEQNHDLVTNITLWPWFVSLHYTLIQLVFPWSGYSGWGSGLLRMSPS